MLLFDRVVRASSQPPSTSPLPAVLVADGHAHICHLATRVAVSALLLEQLVAQLPRHQSVLQPYIALLLQYVFVPDTAAMRDALGGELRCDAVLDAVAAAAAACSRSGAGGGDNDHIRALLLDGNNNNNSSSSEEDEEAGGVGGDVLMRLLTPYARMPYFFAHMQLSRTVVCMAHEVRARQLHIQRMPRIFDLTYRNCSKTLLRTVVCMWAKLCRDRRVHAQKHRAQWARWRSTQRQRVVVRLWRGYAAATLQAATAESVAKARIYEKKAQLQRYRAEMDAMHTTSNELSAAMLAQEQARAEAQAELNTLEVAYTAALEHVRQMARTGSLLMDALLLPRAPPHRVARELAALPQLHASATVLHTLVAWADAELQHGGRETEELCAEVVVAAAGAAAAIGQPATTAAAAAATTPWQQEQQQQQQQQQYDGRADESEVNGTQCVFAQLLLHASPRQMTLFPLYKFLVLMRCIGQKDLNVPAIEVVRMVKTADAAVVTQLLALQRRRDAQQQQQQQQQQQYVPRADDDAVSLVSTNDDDDAGGGGGGGGVTSLLAQLTPELRTTAEDVARILVDSYEHMTNTACVVTAEQLLHRDRGVLLVFLAALLRYYTNWVARKLESVMVEVAPAPSSDNKDSNDNNDNNNKKKTTTDDDATTTAAAAAAARQSRELVGRRHARYVEWYHPPHTHARWRRRVRAQRHWLGVSLSALHRAVLVAKRPRQVLSLEERDRVNALLRCLSLTQLADVLPRDQQLSSRYYVDLMRTLEQRFQQLLQVFQAYAICLDDVVAHDERDGGNTQQQQQQQQMLLAMTTANSSSTSSGNYYNSSAVAGHRASVRGRSATSNKDSADGNNNSSNVDDNDMHNTTTTAAASDMASMTTRSQLSSAQSTYRQQQQRWQTQRHAQLYLTANGFWHLLCDAGLAGSAVQQQQGQPQQQERRSNRTTRNNTTSNSGSPRHHHSSSSNSALVCDEVSGMATLPRPTVLAIVEHVVFTTLRPRRDVMAAEQQHARHAAQQQQGSATTPRAARDDVFAHAHNNNNNNNNSRGSTPRRRTAVASASPASAAPLPPVQVGAARQLPNFARAVLEDRHVDLRYDRGTVCMDALQFAEALIRCAHSWQCLNQQRAAAAAAAATTRSDGKSGGGGRVVVSTHADNNNNNNSSSSRNSSVSGQGNTGWDNNNKAAAATVVVAGAAGAGTSPTRGSRYMSSSVTSAVATARQAQRASVAAGDGATAAPSRLTYEACVHADPLNCEVLEHVMAEWLLPRVLLGAQLLLAPFRRALRRDGVRRLLTRHQDALFTLFTRYTRPREAVGLRGVLPPPYTTHMRNSHANATSSQQRQSPRRATLRRSRSREAMASSSTNPSTMTTTGAAAATTAVARRGSHAARAHRGNTLVGSASSSTAAGAAGAGAAGGGAVVRDVGIVAVLTLDDVTRMAKELSWLQRPRMTLTALQHCYDAVVADAAREGALLFFSEYLDLLCALAFFFDTHPLTPLEDKLSAFLTALVLPHCHS